MSEATVGLILLIILAILSALAAHTFIRRAMRASALAAVCASALFNIAATVHQGHPDALLLAGLFFCWVFAFAIAYVIGIPFRIVRHRRAKPPGHCKACGYNLTGKVSGICPECGTATTPGNEGA